ADFAVFLAAVALCHRDPVGVAIALELAAISGGDGRSRLVPAFEAYVLPDVTQNTADPGWIDVRPDIVADCRGDALRGSCGDDHRYQSAQRGPDEDRLRNAELVQQLDDIAGIGQRIVARGYRIVFAGGAAEKIQRDHAETRRIA